MSLVMTTQVAHKVENFLIKANIRFLRTSSFFSLIYFFSQVNLVAV